MDRKIKGLLVGGVVVGVGRLRDAGRISQEALEARLGAPALDLLDKKIEPASWYPLEAYSELADLLWAIEADRDPEFMRAKGRRWAAKLYEQGVYAQLEYADQGGPIPNGTEAVRRGRRIGSLVQTFWNFVEPIVEMDPDEPGTLCMRFEDAAEFPEANRFTTEGFLDHMLERGGGRAGCSSERPTPDVVIFRMPLGLRDS